MNKVERITNCFNCDVCKRNFKCKSKFLVHKRIHTGEKPYKCEVSDKSFAHKSNLSKTHVGT